MTNEIKEILEELNDMFQLSELDQQVKDIEKITDYITNLQEELEITKEKWEKDKQWSECRTKEWLEYKEENERLKEWKKDLLNENINLEDIRKKAIEYINKHCVNEKVSKEVGFKCYTIADTNELEHIIKLLGGDE